MDDCVLGIAVGRYCLFGVAYMDDSALFWLVEDGHHRAGCLQFPALVPLCGEKVRYTAFVAGAMVV